MSKDNFYTIDKKLAKKLLLDRNGPYSNDQVIAMMEKLDGAVLNDKGVVLKPTDSWE